MELPAELQIIHEPVRLRIMTLLYRQTDVGFAALRDQLDITPGNLASHAQKLVAAGLVEARSALTRSGFERRYQITAQGIQRFEAYLHTLEAFLQTARHTPPTAIAEPAQERPGLTRGGAVAGTLIAGAFFVMSELAVQVLADTSGSAYIGIGATGLVIAALGPLRRLFRG